MRSAVSDGQLYGVPRNSVMRTDGWLVRDDWLQAVGIELEDCSTVTKQEFYDILYALSLIHISGARGARRSSAGRTRRPCRWPAPRPRTSS